MDWRRIQTRDATKADANRAAMSDDERDEAMTAMELAKRLAPALAKMAEAAHEASANAVEIRKDSERIDAREARDAGWTARESG